jgi:hypothetical protein
VRQNQKSAGNVKWQQMDHIPLPQKVTINHSVIKMEKREKKEVGYYAEQFANCKSMLDH